MVSISWLFLLFAGIASAAARDDRQKGPNSTPTCTPVAGGSSTIDDTPAIESAINSCPNGTTVIPQGTTYNIGSQLQFTGCEGCTLQVDGSLQVTVNFTYWNNKGAIFLMRNITNATLQSYTGQGVIDGNGQASWDYIINNDTSYSRPYLFEVYESTGFQMYDMTFRNAPSFHVVTTGGSEHIYYSNITLYSVSNSSNVAHNTDGFDIGPASYVIVENVHVTNDDDCIVLKPGANYVHAKDITCVGSHGLSVGSLGSSSTANDTVTNSLFERAIMNGSAKAAGIKVYPGGPSHGTATVVNVTWKDVVCENCDYAMQIQQCYGETDTYCSEYPSTALIRDVLFQNFTGVTSQSVVANLDCPGNGTCGVKVEDMSVIANNGDNTLLCANIPIDIGVNCTTGASG